MNEDDILDYPNKEHENDTMIIKWNRIELTGLFAKVTNIVYILWVLRLIATFGVWCYKNYIV